MVATPVSPAPSPRAEPAPGERFGSGRSVPRLEDDALVRGEGRFADNVSAPGQVYAAFQRSPHAHARITRIDATEARALPGVLLVLTGKDLVAAGVRPLPAAGDFRRADGAPAASPVRHVVAVDVVRHVGEAVAVVVAAT